MYPSTQMQWTVLIYCNFSVCLNRVLRENMRNLVESTCNFNFVFNPNRNNEICK